MYTGRIASAAPVSNFFKVKMVGFRDKQSLKYFEYTHVRFRHCEEHSRPYLHFACFYNPQF